MPIDLELGEIENYGGRYRSGDYLLNRDGTCDYGKIMDPSEIEAYEVFGEVNLIRKHQGKEKHTFKQFRGGNTRIQNRKRVSVKIKTSFGKQRERKQNPVARRARLSKDEGVNWECAFEQMIQGWGQAENKTSCFDRGNTDRFKAQFPIWIAKTKRWANTSPAIENLGGTKRK